MLKNNIWSKKNEVISVVILIIFVIYLCISNIIQIKSYAAQSTQDYSSKINNYPGYKELIDNLS